MKAKRNKKPKHKDIEKYFREDLCPNTFARGFTAADNSFVTRILRSTTAFKHIWYLASKWFTLRNLNRLYYSNYKLKRKRKYG